MIATVLVLPLAAASASGSSWIGEIAEHLDTAGANLPAQPVYLDALERIEDAVSAGDTARARKEMGRLIAMIGSRAGGLSPDGARDVLHFIRHVTPPIYFDEEAKSHLRLIEEFYSGRDELDLRDTTEYPLGGLSRWTFENADAFEFPWPRRTNPVVILGSGVLGLIVIGSLVFIGLALRLRQQAGRADAAQGAVSKKKGDGRNRQRVA